MSEKKFQIHWGDEPKQTLNETQPVPVTEPDTQLTDAEILTSPTPHPFDEPEFREFLEAEFPDLVERIKNATRPQVSDHPDDFETWEALQILKRKQRFAFEKGRNYPYLMRLLYEECFSVNQNPGVDNAPTMMDTYGMVPGGLLSHFLNLGSSDGYSVEKLTADNFSGSTLRELIENSSNTQDYQTRRLYDGIARVVVDNTYNIMKESWLHSRALRAIQFRQRGNNSPYPPELDAVGVRLLTMLRDTPEMREAVTDISLLELCNIKRSTVARYELFIFVWRYFSPKLINPSGTYKSEDDEGVKEAVTKLLTFRTHPEMQIFFKYFSPSGYINQDPH